jgi:hypothetical protein
LEELWPNPALAAILYERRRGKEPHSRPPPREDAGLKRRQDAKTTRGTYTTRVRPPLSQSLWPERPLEKRERGVDGPTRTLEVAEGRGKPERRSDNVVVRWLVKDCSTLEQHPYGIPVKKRH